MKPSEMELRLAKELHAAYVESEWSNGRHEGLKNWRTMPLNQRAALIAMARRAIRFCTEEVEKFVAEQQRKLRAGFGYMAKKERTR